MKTTPTDAAIEPKVPPPHGAPQPGVLPFYVVLGASPMGGGAGGHILTYRAVHSTFSIHFFFPGVSPNMAVCRTRGLQWNMAHK